jgi:hypothetical protein
MTNEDTRKMIAVETKPAPCHQTRKRGARRKRPLSAYNIFYQTESLKLQDERRATFRKMIQSSASTESFKAIDKMGFVDLARYMASKWSTLDEQSKAHFQTLARTELIMYNEEMQTRQVHGLPQELLPRITSVPAHPINSTIIEAPLHCSDGQVNKFDLPATKTDELLAGSGDLASADSQVTLNVPSKEVLPYSSPSLSSWLLAATLPNVTTSIPSQTRVCQTSMLPSSPAAPLQKALNCMPSLPTYEAATSGYSIGLKSPADETSCFRWIDHSKTPSQQLPPPSQQLSPSNQLYMMDRLSSSMDEDEQDFFISCFSTQNKEQQTKPTLTRGKHRREI